MVTEGDKGGLGESYGAFVKRQFKKSRMGLWSLYFVMVMSCVALMADFLANDKPLIAQYKGEVVLPIFREYSTQLGLMEWYKGELSNCDWRTLGYDWAVRAPVAYSPQAADGSVISLESGRPSSKHWLGTDDIGRDVLAGLIHGSRYALAIGLVAMGISLCVGIVLGLIAGYFGGWVDVLVSRMIELVITFPTFFLIITIVAMVQAGSIWLIMALIGLTGWTGIARFVRGEVLRIRSLDFVSAAQALGYSTSRIIFRHVLPNALAPVLVSAAFGIAGAILTVSALSFLGFGVPPTVVTWGSVLLKARNSVNAWWLAVFPGMMIFMTVSAYNFIGDALRDATDPRLRH